jgi:hypothetical protein
MDRSIDGWIDGWRWTDGSIVGWMILSTGGGSGSSFVFCIVERTGRRLFFFFLSESIRSFPVCLPLPHLLQT